jgi:hypothetical protein
MLRNLAAVAIVICLSPVAVYAQDQVFAVSAQTADVYKSPSTGSPVIGHAPRGAQFIVTRNLGSWVKVAWPEAPDGAGYLHVSMGRVMSPAEARNMVAAAPATATAAPASAVRAAGSNSARSGSASRGSTSPGSSAAARPASSTTAGSARGASSGSPGSSNTAQTDQRQPGAIPLAPNTPGAQPVYVTPATHRFAVGGVVTGSSIGYGASARTWRRRHLGVQFEMSHTSQTDAAVPGQLATTRFEPTVLYALPDQIGGAFWLRPYVGAGLHVRHDSLSPTVTDVQPSTSDNVFGLHAIGGGELTFAGAPRFVLSAGVILRHAGESSIVEVDDKAVGFSLAGHWYFR